MEHWNYVLYQFLGVILFITALTMFYRTGQELDRAIDYRIEHIHNQKALEPI